MRIACIVLAAAACGETERVQELWVVPDGVDGNPCSAHAPMTLVAARRDPRGQCRSRDREPARWSQRARRDVHAVGARSRHHVSRGAGDTPIMSGGRVVGAWEPGAPGLVRSTVPFAMRALWLDGQRAPRLRVPAR